MATTYRLDIRYIPEPGVNALKRVERLSESLSGEGFDVSDVSVFDDGMRVSVLLTSGSGGRNELKLLALVSETGAIGRFSCRDADEVDAAEETKKSEPALA